MSKTEGSRESLRWFFLWCLVMAVTIGLLCAGILFWSPTSKFKIADVEQMISTSLPIGTPKKEVKAWLTIRSMRVNHCQDEQGRPFIESWIPDSGPPTELSFGIRDIRLQFFFDESERLVRFTVKEEDRF